MTARVDVVTWVTFRLGAVDAVTVPLNLFALPMYEDRVLPFEIAFKKSGVDPEGGVKVIW